MLQQQLICCQFWEKQKLQTFVQLILQQQSYHFYIGQNVRGHELKTKKRHYFFPQTCLKLLFFLQSFLSCLDFSIPNLNIYELVLKTSILSVMQINKFDSLHNKRGIGQTPKSLVNKQEVAFYLIFFILFLIIDIALIIQQSQHYFYIDILKNYKDDMKKIPKNQNYEFYSQLKWDENKITTYSGQIIIIDQDDDIILTLNDITKQNKIQEEKIKDQFKTIERNVFYYQIIQSFSHELRTPLNSALNFLQFCDNNIYEEFKKNFICPAINALRLYSYLINDIIDFSYLCSDNLELDITQITISSIVDEINKLFKSVLSMKNISLYIDLTNNVIVMIRTDFSRLILILANLIQNSIKFSSEGMIIVKFLSTSQVVLKITIRDQGIGIDELGLHKIKKLLTDIEERKTFSQLETWHGFGLLISQMLIQKLKLTDQKSLQIFQKDQ